MKFTEDKPVSAFALAAYARKLRKSDKTLTRERALKIAAADDAWRLGIYEELRTGSDTRRA